jgi:hypothetical protein
MGCWMLMLLLGSSGFFCLFGGWVVGLGFWPLLDLFVDY